MNKPVLYSPGGINHIVDTVAELFEREIRPKQRIVVNCSAQPNGIPHFGTLTTVMCAFAVAHHLAETYDKPAIVLFDVLENSPGDSKVDSNGHKYTRWLRDTYDEDEGKSTYERNIVWYEDMFNRLSKISDIPYRFRLFSDYQREATVRACIVEVMEHRDALAPLLNPKENKLHFRISCPTCGFSDKSCVHTSIISKEGRLIISSSCPEHGAFSVDVNDQSTEIDFNAQLRDLIKGLYIERAMAGEDFITMCDGGDWAGIWALRVHSEAMNVMGHLYHTPRLFCPVILDWSGAKFSKSLYMVEGAYDYLPRGLQSYKDFLDAYGENGMELLWHEISEWPGDSKRFFRDYSIEYISSVIGEGEQE